MIWYALDGLIVTLYNIASEGFALFENWSLTNSMINPLRSSHGICTTQMISVYQNLCFFLVNSLHSICVTRLQNSEFQETKVSKTYAEKVRNAANTSLDIILEGIKTLMTQGVMKTANEDKHFQFLPLVHKPLKTNLPSSLEIFAIFGSLQAPPSSAFTDYTEHDSDLMETRLFLSLDNIAGLKQLFLPRINTVFEAKFSKKEAVTGSALEKLERIITFNYLRQKTIPIKENVKEGILYSGIDWGSFAKPQGMRI